MSSTGAIIRPGEHLGGYEIEDVIGIGGMAVVYRARQVSLDRIVALKVLSAQFTRDDSFRERFRREAMHAASLEHPNIVPVYDSGEVDGQLYIAMRFIEGGTLADRMVGGGLSPADAIAVLRPIASALDAAHSVGLVHRDVKPQNILMTDGGHPYLADFGVAKGGESAGLTATGGFVGSVNYASPEQIRGETLAAASDIYSLTALAYQCLTGQVPYPRETDAGVMHAHLSEPPPKLDELDYPAATSLQEAIARGMDKHPEARFGSCAALVTAIDAAVSSMPSAHRSGQSRFGGSLRVPAPAMGGVQKPQKSKPVTGEATTADAKRAPVLEEADTVPKPSGPPRWKRVAGARATPLVAAGVLAATAIVLGFTLAPNAPDEPEVVTASAAALRVPVPQPWVRVSGGEQIAGVKLEQPASVSTTGTTGETAFAQLGPLAEQDEMRGGLPRSVRRALTKDPKVTPVSIGDIPAIRYDGELESGGQALRIYVIATERGDYAVACRLPGSASATRACDRLAAGVSFAGVSSQETGADPAVAKALAAALAPVVASRKGRGLRAKGVQARAARARDMAAANLKGAQAVARIDAPPAERAELRQLARALRTEAPVLRRLAGAATRRERTRYNTARERVVVLERSIRAALDDLQTLGYRIG